MTAHMLSRWTALPVLALALVGPDVPVARTAARACDGSAIVDVGGGHLLNATDEDNVIRLYANGVIARPISEFNLNAFLKPAVNKRGIPKEVDIEGVARIDSRLYLDRIARQRPERSPRGQS